MKNTKPSRKLRKTYDNACMKRMGISRSDVKATWKMDAFSKEEIKTSLRHMADHPEENLVVPSLNDWHRNVFIGAVLHRNSSDTSSMISNADKLTDKRFSAVCKQILSN